MKKFLVLLLSFTAICGITQAQTISINGFGGYNFQDQVNFGSVYGYVKEGGFWGVSLEGINKQGSGIELLYQQQNTQVPLYLYNTGVAANKDKTGAVISYIMLNGMRYLKNNEKVEPYAGLGIGAGITSPESGSSSSKFAWDLKLGVKFKPGSTVGIKIQAQLFSVVQASGAGFYVGTGGAGVGVSSYSTIYQFGFVGGLCFDLDRGKK
jgi:opacity protein-like surface antigen